MSDKHEHMLDADTTTDVGLVLALAKAVCNEGISLFASFAMLLNFQRKGKMKGMGKVVEWSQRDETIHVDGIARVLGALLDDKPELITPAVKLKLYELFRHTVELEDAFVDLAFDLGGIEGLTAKEVKRYVRFIANRRLTQIGLKENWPEIESNPLPWVDWLVAGADHTNFFEGKVTEYDVAGLTGDIEYDSVPQGVEFVIHTKPDCPYCVTAKFDLASIPYAKVRVVAHDDDEDRAFFYLQNGFKGRAGPMAASMPKVYFVDSRGIEVLIGGADHLKDWMRDRGFLQPVA
jgi:glutaredoxin